MNAALFRNARYHDHWAIYHDDEWTDRDAEGYQLADSVRLIRTPGSWRGVRAGAGHAALNRM